MIWSFPVAALRGEGPWDEKKAEPNEKAHDRLMHLVQKFIARRICLVGVSSHAPATVSLLRERICLAGLTRKGQRRLEVCKCSSLAFPRCALARRIFMRMQAKHKPINSIMEQPFPKALD